MKFIVDAQLPKSLSDLLNESGYDSIHTVELSERNKTTDTQLKKIAEKENRIVITKDSDFLESHLLSGKPPKLILIKTGNVGNNELLQLFKSHLKNITKSISKCSLIEIHRVGIVIHK